MLFLQTTLIQYNIFNENDRICITILLNLSQGGPFDNMPAWVGSDSGIHYQVALSKGPLSNLYSILAFCLDQTFNKIKITFILATHVYAWTHIMIFTF